MKSIEFEFDKRGIHKYPKLPLPKLGIIRDENINKR